MSFSRRRFLRSIGLGCAGLVISGCQARAAEELPTAAPPTAAPRPTVEIATATKPAAPTAAPAATATVPPATPTAAAKASVAIGRLDSYDPKALRQALESLLDGIGGLGDVIRPGARVAVKVNLTGGAWWETQINRTASEYYVTHPQVVGALCELLRDAGASKISIVEGVYEPESWTVWGYDVMAKAVGAELVDLNGKAPYPDYTRLSPGANPLIYEKFTLNPILEEIDAFVSVPKLKCHYTAGVTVSMKNLVGISPLGLYSQKPGDTSRTAIHGGFQNGVDHHLIGTILDLNRARPVTLAVVDGIMTSEGGEGPWIKTMKAVQANVLMAGKDPLATDVVGTALMGFDPAAADKSAPFIRSENYLRMAGELGMGINSLEDIRIVGTPVEDVKMNFAVAKG